MEIHINKCGKFPNNKKNKNEEHIYASTNEARVGREEQHG